VEQAQASGELEKKAKCELLRKLGRKCCDLR